MNARRPTSPRLERDRRPGKPKISFQFGADVRRVTGRADECPDTAGIDGPDDPSHVECRRWSGGIVCREEDDQVVPHGRRRAAPVGLMWVFSTEPFALRIILAPVSRLITVSSLPLPAEM